MHLGAHNTVTGVGSNSQLHDLAIHSGILHGDGTTGIEFHFDVVDDLLELNNDLDVGSGHLESDSIHQVCGVGSAVDFVMQLSADNAVAGVGSDSQLDDLVEGCGFLNLNSAALVCLNGDVVDIQGPDSLIGRIAGDGCGDFGSPAGVGVTLAGGNLEDGSCGSGEVGNSVSGLAVLAVCVDGVDLVCKDLALSAVGVSNSVLLGQPQGLAVQLFSVVCPGGSYHSPAGAILLVVSGGAGVLQGEAEVISAVVVLLPNGQDIGLTGLLAQSSNEGAQVSDSDIHIELAVLGVHLAHGVAALGELLHGKLLGVGRILVAGVTDPKQSAANLAQVGHAGCGVAVNGNHILLHGQPHTGDFLLGAVQAGEVGIVVQVEDVVGDIIVVGHAAKVVLLGGRIVDQAQHAGTDLALCLPAAQFLIPLDGTLNRGNMAAEPVAQPAVIMVHSTLDGKQLVGHVADIGIGQPLGGDGGVTCDSVDGLSGNLIALLVIPAQEGTLGPGGNGQLADGCVIGDGDGSGINLAAIGIQGQGVVVGIPDRVSLNGAALNLGKVDLNGLAQCVSLLIDDPAEQLITGTDKAIAVIQGHGCVIGIAVLDQQPLVVAVEISTHIHAFAGIVLDGVGVGAPDCVSLDGAALNRVKVLLNGLTGHVSFIVNDPAYQGVAITDEALAAVQGDGSIVGVTVLDEHPVIAAVGLGTHISTFTGIVLDGVGVGLPDCVSLNGAVLNCMEVPLDGLTQSIGLSLDNPANQSIAGTDKVLTAIQGHGSIVGVAVLDEHPVIAAAERRTDIGAFTGIVHDGVGNCLPLCDIGHASGDGVANLGTPADEIVSLTCGGTLKCGSFLTYLDGVLLISEDFLAVNAVGVGDGVHLQSIGECNPVFCSHLTAVALDLNLADGVHNNAVHDQLDLVGYSILRSNPLGVGPGVALAGHHADGTGELIESAGCGELCGVQSRGGQQGFATVQLQLNACVVVDITQVHVDAAIAIILRGIQVGSDDFACCLFRLGSRLLSASLFAVAVILIRCLIQRGLAGSIFAGCEGFHGNRGEEHYQTQEQRQQSLGCFHFFHSFS